MLSIEKLQKNFGEFKIPKELIDLLHFQNEHGFENYSECFGLLQDEYYGLEQFVDHQDFLDNILPFAQANSSGSIYALWNHGQNDLKQIPVVVFWAMKVECIL